LADALPEGASSNIIKKGSAVEHTWEHPVPLFPKAMAMSGKTMLVSGPADTINEEFALEQLSKKDPTILVQLKEQDEALMANAVPVFRTVSAETGKMASELKLKSPPVWDGMAVARGRVFVATVDGKIVCFGSDEKQGMKKKLE
jgi:hypothetical protein